MVSRRYAGENVDRPVAGRRIRNSNRRDAQAGKQGIVALDIRVTGGEQEIAIEHGIGTGQKHMACSSSLILRRPADRRTQEVGMVMRAAAMVRTNSKGSRRGLSASGVPGIGTRLLIGTDSGGFGRLASCTINPARFLARFAHTDDAARADIDTRIAHLIQRIETIIVGMSLDDLAVELLVGVRLWL